MNALKSLLRPLKDWRIGRLPSRVFLKDRVIPELAAAGRKRLLFVGTRSYNRPAYEKCLAVGIEAWSVDLDPAAAAYGAPAGHFVGNVCDIGGLVGERSFDAIIFNGVLGWGLNAADEAVRALEAMAKVAPGGLLFVGWNPGLTDGSEMAAMRPMLKRAAIGAVPQEIEFPPRGSAQRYPHRYELFTLP